MKALKFEHIDKIYPNHVQAVFDFNLEIEEGEFVVFVGPSGCGKSTILRMVAGLEEISAGTMTLDDKVINKVAPQDRNISFVFQNYALYGNLTVYENVGMSMKVRHEDEVDIHEAVMPISDMLGLKPYLNRYPDQLSGGQKQRVALGRAITRHPKVFLMDEPLSNLDAKLRSETRIEIVKLQRKLGVTTIYVTHDQVEAMAMADRIVLLKDGRVQQIDTPYNVYNNPANMFVASFIGTPQINFIKGEIRDGCVHAGALKLQLNGDQQKRLKDYRTVVMGIRPEDIQVAEGGLPAMVELPVTGSMFYGDYVTINLELEGQEVVSKHKGFIDITDTKLELYVNVDHVHFFDPETEKTIGWEES